jgi:hypothetical protein
MEQREKRYYVKYKIEKDIEFVDGPCLKPSEKWLFNNKLPRNTCNFLLLTISSFEIIDNNIKIC